MTTLFAGWLIGVGAVVAHVTPTVVSACPEGAEFDRLVREDWTELARGDLVPAIGVKRLSPTPRWEFVGLRIAGVPALTSCKLRGDAATVTYRVTVEAAASAAFGPAEACRSKPLRECLAGGGVATEIPKDREAIYTESQEFTVEFRRVGDHWEPAAMLRDAFIRFECGTGMMACPPAPAVCRVGGLGVGDPAPDLKAPGAYEIARPADVKIPDAKLRRSLILEGDRPKYQQYVAVRDGTLVAVVREFGDPSGIYQGFVDRYGPARVDSLLGSPSPSFTPIGVVSKSRATAYWKDPACGLRIDYLESATSNSAFGVSGGSSRATVVWSQSQPEAPLVP